MARHPTPLEVRDLLSKTKYPKCEDSVVLVYGNEGDTVSVNCKPCGPQLYSWPGYLEMGWEGNPFADERDV